MPGPRQRPSPADASCPSCGKASHDDQLVGNLEQLVFGQSAQQGRHRVQHLMNDTKRPLASQACSDPTDVGATRLTTRQRWTLLVITLVVVVVTIAITVYQHVAPEMRLQADGYAKVAMAEHYDVWAKTSHGEISLELRRGDDTRCVSGGPFQVTGYAICQEVVAGRSALAAVVPVGARPTVTLAGERERALTVVHPRGWPYALAIAVAADESLQDATLNESP